MSAALCVALAWLASLAGAAEYVDYSGASMPLFEGGEYEAAREPPPPARGPPPPARYPHPPARYPHLQPHRETTEPSYILKEDTEVRPQSIKKPSHELQPVDEEEDIIDIFDKYKYEEPQSFKSSEPYAKRRPARIGYSPRDESTSPPRGGARRGRPWAGGDGDEYDEPSDADERDRERSSRVRMPDDDGYRASHRRNGKMRRQPRARGVRNRPEDVTEDDDNDEVGTGWSKGDDAVNIERREDTGQAYDEARRRGGGEAQYEEAAEYESTPPPPPPRARTRAHRYNQEYYDMQRVKSNKNKLPALKRPTQARLGEAATPPRRPPAALAQRRQDTPGNSTGAATAAPTTPAPTTATSTTPAPTRTDVAELSIAEKSRLSILKKAQRKESVDVEAATAKPPVLLHVTQRLQTVVMVEGGGGSGDRGGGARLVAQDSPERLAKVRRLMRHKLVAGARSVQDLTDNWDELVCDYFDVRALDSAAPAPPARRLALLLCVCAISTKII